MRRPARRREREKGQCNKLLCLPRTATLQPKDMSLSLAQSDFSTCELSDALIKLGVPHGGHIPDIRRVSPHTPDSGTPGVRLCGPAYTVRIVLATDRVAPKLQKQSHFVDLAPEGSVAFVSAPPGLLASHPNLPHSVFN